MSKHSLKFLLGKYRDPDSTSKSVKELQQAGIKVYDVYSPFPIHGMEKLLGFKRSRLTVAAFLFGMTGTTAAVLMQVFMLVWDWPMDIGGKPNFQGPAIVPVTFELTVLFAAFGMVFTFFFVNKMFPWKNANIMDPRVTDDVFVVAVEQENIKDRGEAEAILNRTGAFEISEKEIDDEHFDVNYGS